MCFHISLTPGLFPCNNKLKKKNPKPLGEEEESTGPESNFPSLLVCKTHVCLFLK